jgi:molybdenum cofactor biosynthesis enzyme MoaA
MNTSFDLNRCPLLVIWETTQACDLACCHCRACAQSKRHPLELTTLEAEKLIRDVANLNPPIFILTGGDPLKRADIFYLVRRAVAYGLHPAMTPSATPLLTREAIADLKRAKLSRLAVSLDGSVPELHDAFRGVNGSYARTLEAIHWANEFGLPIQVNTSISKRNVGDLENMAPVEAVQTGAVERILPGAHGTGADGRPSLRRGSGTSIRHAIPLFQRAALQGEDNRGAALPPLHHPAAAQEQRPKTICSRRQRLGKNHPRTSTHQ